MKTLVITHGKCSDGTAAAWCVFAAAKLNNNLHDYEFYYASERDFYNDKKMPSIEGKNIIILDYSYNRQTILDIIAKCTNTGGNFLLLDHHITAEKELNNIPGCYFDMKLSACQMAWNHFMALSALHVSVLHIRPHFIECIAGRDLWTFDPPDSRPFSAGVMGRYRLTFDLLDKLYAEYEKNNVTLITEIIEFGKQMLNVEQTYINQILGGAGLFTMWMKFGTNNNVQLMSQYKVWVAETRILRSEVGNQLAMRPDCDFSLCWSYDVVLREFWCGLRSTDNSIINVGDIAKCFPNGGGHKNAAGFTLKNMSISDLLTPI